MNKFVIVKPIVLPATTNLKVFAKQKIRLVSGVRITYALKAISGATVSMTVQMARMSRKRRVVTSPPALTRVKMVTPWKNLCAVIV